MCIFYIFVCCMKLIPDEIVINGNVSPVDVLLIAGSNE